MQATSIRFAAAVRSLADTTRGLGLSVPGFRSPLRLAGVSRSLRRGPANSITIAVVLRDRPWVAVLADMIEGVVVANALTGPAADRCRTALWAAVDGGGLQAA